MVGVLSIALVRGRLSRVPRNRLTLTEPGGPLYDQPHYSVGRSFVARRLHHVFFAALLLWAPGAFAYTCDQGCGDQCWIETPFGGNINPLCQASCQTWKHANCHNLTPQSACGSVGAAGYLNASNTMWERSVGKKRRPMTFEEITILKDMYPVDQLRRTMLHFGVQPMDKIGGGAFKMSAGSEAQTYGYHIYFKDRESVATAYNVSWIQLLAHESKHVQQYRDRGESLTKFGRHYFEGWCANGFKYNRIPMEREAFNVEDNAKALAERFFSSGGIQPGDNRLSITCLSNTTSFPIKYFARWKETGDWELYTIEPGRWRSHYWNYSYANQNSSPKLYVKFDFDLNEGGSQFKEYWLTRFARPDSDCNRMREREEFKTTDNGTKIDLFKNY
jgi:hypothetical protein